MQIIFLLQEKLVIFILLGILCILQLLLIIKKYLGMFLKII